MKIPCRGKGPFVAFLALAVMVLASSCAGPMATARLRYDSELARWTRRAHLYNGMEERLALVATYRGAAFREAYRDYYALSFGLTEKDRARLQKEDQMAGRKYSEFFLSVHTSEEAYNNLEARGSPWRIYLVDSTGKRVEPLSIDRLERIDPLRAEFFPYVDLWSTAYVLRFPYQGGKGVPSENASYIKLVIKSVLGEVEMTWDLGPERG